MAETCDPRVIVSSPEEGKRVHPGGELDTLLSRFVVKLDGFEWEIQTFAKSKVNDDA